MGMEAPTGYESKLNWLKMLLKMVEAERKVIEKEDELIEAECKMKSDVIMVIADDKNENEVVIESSSTSVSSESDRDEEVLSSPNCNSSPDMIMQRSMYKRNRANTSALLGSPVRRKMSRQDLQRRRFISQDSVKSIQSIIANIEKKRNANK